MSEGERGTWWAENVDGFGGGGLTGAGLRPTFGLRGGGGGGRGLVVLSEDGAVEGGEVATKRVGQRNGCSERASGLERSMATQHKERRKNITWSHSTCQSHPPLNSILWALFWPPDMHRCNPLSRPSRRKFRISPSCTTTCSPSGLCLSRFSPLPPLLDPSGQSLLV